MLIAGIFDNLNINGTGWVLILSAVVMLFGSKIAPFLTPLIPVLNILLGTLKMKIVPIDGPAPDPNVPTPTPGPAPDILSLILSLIGQLKLRGDDKGLKLATEILECHDCQDPTHQHEKKAA